ncbi:RNA polymerase sigma factor [Brachybacterium phenoliresistens]|uniref:RNA polymerase subunit sigma-24 n=1 Tax=Brachybacterium phenoliresistens TaxID=396014 RepID=Z9JRZ1_9MICO|nr:sigma-70 family RNA polymerase sigma factor [Brachybacterium phenoliresistens]EWS80551.1 RNA polymerase subunit sigma-24 [Brachybacterium phenoliresistens]
MAAPSGDARGTHLARIEHVLREQTPHVLGALVRRFGRFDLAEDAVQEALIVAARRWAADGLPDGPRAWLIRVAYRRMIDLLRSEQAARRREEDAASTDLVLVDPAAPRPAAVDRDDSLQLLLLCCHPALSETSQIALTLRAVGGLTTAEIAHAYGAAEATMGSRISRAKQTLKKAGARFELRDSDDLAARTTAVMRVLYLIFNEGYTATAGSDLTRAALTAEAIRLTRMLRALLPDDVEVAGLLALMLLTDARRDARTDPEDGLVVLSEQDRTLWDRPLIAEGQRLIEDAWRQERVGPYQLQAAIAAIHAQADTAEATDWPQIAALYLWLERLDPTAPIRLSRVVAVAHAFGPHRGLALLDQLDREHALTEDPLVAQRTHAVRAHLLDQLGEHERAADAYRAAAALTENETERRYLHRRARRSAPEQESQPRGAQAADDAATCTDVPRGRPGRV